jgi:hypothetical protein
MPVKVLEGLWIRETSKYANYLDNRSQMAVRLSALLTGRHPFTTSKIPDTNFDPRVTVRQEELCYLIANQSHDLPVYSIWYLIFLSYRIHQ